MRIIYAGESHMDGVVAVIEGFPAGYEINEDGINRDLARRQRGYGRGKRMQIENDKVKIYSGVIDGKTIGSPITLMVSNYDNRRETWDKYGKQTIPRPGHADFPGLIKYGFDDVRLVAERASARHTAAWVAAGSLMARFLEIFGIQIIGYVNNVGGIETSPPPDPFTVKDLIENSPFRIADESKTNTIKELVDRSLEEGETLGGVVTVLARGAPVGLGSYVQPDCRLDARLAGAFMAIPSVKAVEIGDGFKSASLPGSKAIDYLFVESGKIKRRTNHAGGVEGGISNGEDIIVRAGFKPIPTTGKSNPSVNLETMQEAQSPYVRSDVCAAPAISVIGEAVMATVLAGAFLERYGADTFKEVRAKYQE